MFTQPRTPAEVMKIMGMKKVALLGDSIFDNASYVEPGESVFEQIIQRPKKGWDAELMAKDRGVMGDVVSQCRHATRDTTHLVISCGGNDALGYIPVFQQQASSVAEAMELFTPVKKIFQRKYREMLADVLVFDKATAVCTIYDAIPGLQESLLTALSIFNEVILKEAFRAKIPVIDLRLICNEQSDYSTVSPIEPSESGGEKIVRVIANLIENHDFTQNRSVIYT
jgi:hypothetical protein